MSDPASAQTSAAPDSTAFERLGGEAGVRSLVDRFYDLMEPGASLRRVARDPSQYAGGLA